MNDLSVEIFPFHEKKEQMLVQTTVKQGMTVFDIGANIGHYSILFSQLVGQSGKVYSFEPTSSTFKKLLKRLKEHQCSNVFPFQKAIFSENKLLEFNEFPDEYSSWNSIGRPQMNDPNSPANYVPIVNTEIVEAVRLDTFCEANNIKNIDYLKIDVEGAESYVLEGAISLLKRKAISFLQFEISQKMLEGLNCQAKDTFNILIENGYECHRINSDGSFGKLVNDSNSFYENYIAFPSKTFSQRESIEMFWDDIKLVNEPNLKLNSSTLVKKILFVGDTVPKSPFSFGELLKGLCKQHEVGVFNLEGTFSEVQKPLFKAGPHLLLNPQFFTPLAECFNVAILANNHSMDFGLEGLQKTREICQSHQVATVGAGMNLQEAFAPLDIGNCRIIAVAENEFGAAQANKGGIATVDRALEIYHYIKEGKESGKFVVVVGHGGTEVIPIPPPYLRDRYKLWVEYGADLIIGNHPHSVQGHEVHNDKYIFYSLGNFAFIDDSFQEYPNTNWSIAVSVDIETENLEVIPLTFDENNCIDVSKNSEFEEEYQRLCRLIQSSDYETIYENIATELYPLWYPRLGIANKQDAALLLHYLRCDAHINIVEKALSRIIGELEINNPDSYLFKESNKETQKIDLGREDENWFTHGKSFEQLLSNYVGEPNLLFLELGSWKGRSALWLVENILTGVNSKLICVDVWDVNEWEKEAEETISLFKNPQRMEELKVDRLYETFLQNTEHFREKIIPRRQTTIEALQELCNQNVKFDFIYIDANHTAKAVYQDFSFAYQCLKPGGIVFFDDTNWKSVEIALKRIVRDFKIEIVNADANGAYFIYSQDLDKNKQNNSKTTMIVSELNHSVTENEKKVFETDWLASRPVFYNEKNGKVSYNINDVIDFTNFEFHPEGLNNYLDFGYSVLEQTPIKDVKFLRHSSRLTVDNDGCIEIEHLEDVVDKWIGKTSHEDDVLHLLHTAIRNWERSVEGEIIIPTSGGYDSRILNYFIEDKSRIRAFSYGIEAVYAKKLSEILNIKWEKVDLGNQHLYFDEWDKIFGISTHAHGMYHIEFYNKLLSQVVGENPLASGIVGDAWAGNIGLKNISSPEELYNMGLTHRVCVDSSHSCFISSSDIREKFWLENSDKLQHEFYQIIFLIRFKMILVSYLMTVPSHFGFKPWSPFLEPEIALSMLTLPSSRRQNRIWQREFFFKNGLDLELTNLKVSIEDDIDYQAMCGIPVQPLDDELLGEVIKSQYVQSVNHYVGQNNLLAYYAYVTLKPIENILKKRMELVANLKDNTSGISNAQQISPNEKLLFNLRKINLILFPDWNKSESDIAPELSQVIQRILTHPDKNQIALLIDTSNISEENADLILSGVVINLLMEEDLDVNEGPEISLIGGLSERQWSNLLADVKYKIYLENENQEQANMRGSKLPVLKINEEEVKV
ncbi:MAG: FkbM family methyltransferase [Okeania sp. SIO3B5]|uniref:FkbM family methyltransferase n=1 Tax=Okeania sp. SIO3B5 TaxID=2607811 RepID=UPI0013FEC83F|nr:FkbM family methyltransferase [Okeania sp. SIO3B5]NEO52982.1 FkbM family methyltransferase [Okeania sp. SIO3B5]